MADISTVWITSGAESWRDLVTNGPFKKERWIAKFPVGDDYAFELEVLRVCVGALEGACGPSDPTIFAYWDGGWEAPESSARMRVGERSYNLVSYEHEYRSSDLGVFLGESGSTPPAMIWAADRSWFIANDVDSEFIAVSGDQQAALAVAFLPIQGVFWATPTLH